MANTITYLVFPFRHACDDEQLRAAQAPDGWSHWFSRLTTAEFDSMVDHSYAFVPPIRSTICPEFANQGRDEIAEAFRQIRLNTSFAPSKVREAFNSPAEHQACALRLTLSRTMPWSSGLRFTYAHQGKEVVSGVSFRWIDVILFPGSVGHVLVCIEPEAGLSNDQAAVLLRHVRKIVNRRQISPSSPTVTDMDGSEISWASILDQLLSGFRRAQDLPVAEDTVSPFGIQWVNWHMMCLLEVDLPSASAAFADKLEQAAFAIATGRSTIETQNQPSLERLTELRRNQIFKFWDNWLALHHYGTLSAVVDSSASVRPDEFAQQQSTFEHEYLLIFVLVLTQRAMIDLLKADAAAMHGSARKSFEKLRTIERSLVRQRSRLWFDEMMMSPTGMPLYEMLRQTYGLQPGLDSLLVDLQHLRNTLEDIQVQQDSVVSRRTETLLQLIAVVGLPLTVALTLLESRLQATDVIMNLETRQAWIIVAVTLVVSIVVFVLLRIGYRRRLEDL